MSSNLNPEEEKDLIQRCIRGDRRAQRELYETFSPLLFAVALRYVGSRENAKDVLQEGFITIFDKIGTYKGDGSFQGWLRKIVANTALMYIRKNDVLKFADDVDTTPLKGNDFLSENALDVIGTKEIMNLICQMPEGFRVVFNLYIFEGYSHAEIAKAIGITEGSSRSQLSRGRVWLQERIKKFNNDR